MILFRSIILTKITPKYSWHDLGTQVPTLSLSARLLSQNWLTDFICKNCPKLLFKTNVNVFHFCFDFPVQACLNMSFCSLEQLLGALLHTVGISHLPLTSIVYVLLPNSLSKFSFPLIPSLFKEHFLPFLWDQDMTSDTSFLKLNWISLILTASSATTTSVILTPSCALLNHFIPFQSQPAVTISTRDLNLVKLELVSSQAQLPLITSSLPTVRVHKLTSDSHNALCTRVAPNSWNFFA